jgi:hypothetical protein
MCCTLWRYWYFIKLDYIYKFQFLFFTIEDTLYKKLDLIKFLFYKIYQIVIKSLRGLKIKNH